MESQTSETKGDRKTYESNLSEPRYSKVPSKQRRGPNRGAISEGSRGASATWGSGLPCFDVGRCDVGDPRVCSVRGKVSIV